jgi:hypothetical protein
VRRRRLLASCCSRVVVLVLEAEAIVSGWAGVVVVAVVGVVADGTAPALPCCCSRRAGVAPPRGWLRVLLSAQSQNFRTVLARHFEQQGFAPL